MPGIVQQLLRHRRMHMAGRLAWDCKLTGRSLRAILDGPGCLGDIALGKNSAASSTEATTCGAMAGWLLDDAYGCWTHFSDLQHQ